MGNLQDISVDSRGVITGYFSNGINQTLAQIALASFNNPTGLLQEGDNVFSVSGNSGEAIVGYAGTSNQSTITPGRAGKLERRPLGGVHEHDHRAAGLPGQRAGHHHRRRDAERAGAVEEIERAVEIPLAGDS